MHPDTFGLNGDPKVYERATELGTIMPLWYLVMSEDILLFLESLGMDIPSVKWVSILTLNAVIISLHEQLLPMNCEFYKTTDWNSGL